MIEKQVKSLIRLTICYNVSMDYIIKHDPCSFLILNGPENKQQVQTLLCNHRFKLVKDSPLKFLHYKVDKKKNLIHLI